VIEEMREIVSRFWRAEVLCSGGTERDCRVIEPAFVYPGFEYAAGG
jgi:hypothetical protein